MIPLLAGAMAASAAAQLAGSLIGANASSDAAAAAAAQEQKALDFQKQQWATTQGNIQPYLTSGQQGLNSYQSKINSASQPEFNYKLPSFNFSTYSDPGAQYQMQQATAALNNSSLAKGLGGGGALKALMAKNQEMAGTAYQGAYDRYLKQNQQDYGYANDQYNRNMNWQNTDIGRQKDLMTQGASMASGLGQLGQNAANSISQGYGNIGASQAGGIAGAGNAWNQGLTGLTNTVGKGLGYYMNSQTPRYNFGQTNNNLGYEDDMTGIMG